MVDLTEEAIVNEDYLKKWKGLRRYHIEYGFECGCPEGLVYLPDTVDPDLVEQFLNNLFHYECRCYG